MWLIFINYHLPINIIETSYDYNNIRVLVYS